MTGQNGYHDIYLTIEKNQIKKSIQPRYRDISLRLIIFDTTDFVDLDVK